MLKIEKGIPFPEERKTKGAKLAALQVGDSILVPAEDAARWRSAMSKTQAGGDYYFVSRTVEGGVRIWRKA